jgi:hypothetical protein
MSSSESTLSLLTFREPERNTILNFLKICDSIHDFKGTRSGDNITENPTFQYIKLKNQVSQHIFSSTVEHNAEEMLLNNSEFSSELKLNLIKLINNSNYKYEITINNELNSVEGSNSEYYMTSEKPTKELKLNIIFDRILYGNKLRDKKYFSKQVLEYFRIQYNNIFGISNRNYLIDAVNIPIHYFLSGTDYLQLIEETNKWDMAPTSAPDNYKTKCSNTMEGYTTNEWSDSIEHEKIIVGDNGETINTDNYSNIQNISKKIIYIDEKKLSDFKNFLDDDNYLFINLNPSEYTLEGSIYEIPILTSELSCYTVQLKLISEKPYFNHCYGYIVFINKETNNATLFASRAYRIINAHQIGVPTLAEQFYNSIKNPDLNNIQQHLSCDINSFILDIKRTGDWAQIIQIYNNYLENKITFISHDNLAILFAKLVNIPYMHTSTNEHYVSINMRNTELASRPSNAEISKNLIDKIENIINKYHLYLDIDFFKHFNIIINKFKDIFITKTYSVNDASINVIINKIFMFIYNVLITIFHQHINNIDKFYKLEELFNTTKVDKKNLDNNILIMNSIYNDLEKLFLLIDNINNEIEYDNEFIIADLDRLKSLNTTNEKNTLTTFSQIKKFFMKVKIMKGNMDLAKSIIFLIEKLNSFIIIRDSSSSRLKSKNEFEKKEILFVVYKQVLSIINKIKFYQNEQLIETNYNLDELLTIFNGQSPKTSIDVKHETQSTTITSGGGYNQIMIGGKVITLRSKKSMEVIIEAFQSKLFQSKLTNTKPNLRTRMKFYYSILSLDKTLEDYKITQINLTLCRNIIRNKKNICLAVKNSNPLQNDYYEYTAETIQTSYYIYNDHPKNIENIGGTSTQFNQFHILAKKFYDLFIKEIFIDNINNFLLLKKISPITYIEPTLKTPIFKKIQDIKTEFNYVEVSSPPSAQSDNITAIPKLDEIDIYRNLIIEKMRSEFTYFINLPLYGAIFNHLKSIETNVRLVDEDNKYINNNDYRNIIADSILSDETYKLLEKPIINIPIICDFRDEQSLPQDVIQKIISETNEYAEWYSHFVIFINILEKIEENRIIVFGSDVLDGGSGNINNFICHENLRQVYVALKYLVSINNDVMYSYEAQTFKNICHFFQIDIPEDININDRNNINEIIFFINNTFVKRYLYIKQNIILDEIYSEWEKQDISNFFKYYDIYTTIKDYQNIVNEINELIKNKTEDLSYCIKQLWGSVESLDMYVEQFFKFKYNDKLILSHVGEIFNKEVSLLKKDETKVDTISVKKTPVLMEIIQSIIENSENGNVTKETVKQFIDEFRKIYDLSQKGYTKSSLFTQKQSRRKTDNFLQILPQTAGSHLFVKKQSRRKK